MFEAAFLVHPAPMDCPDDRAAAVMAAAAQQAVQAAKQNGCAKTVRLCKRPKPNIRRALTVRKES